MNKKDLMIQRLLSGETIYNHKESGNSMSPIIRHRQPMTIQPIQLDKIQINDIILCKVRGRYFVHKVIAVNKKRGVQISNNKGFINGWTKSVYGKIVEVNGKKI